MKTWLVTEKGKICASIDSVSHAGMARDRIEGMRKKQEFEVFSCQDRREKFAMKGSKKKIGKFRVWLYGVLLLAEGFMEVDDFGYQ